jgi:hypothetical protein
MTAADRALVVQALEKRGLTLPSAKELATEYAKGAPLLWGTVGAIETALKNLGTSEALALIARMEELRPSLIPRAEITPVGPPSTPLTFADGYNEGWAEQHGARFILTLNESEVDVIRRAFDRLEEEHLRDRAGIDDFIMGQRARILEGLDQGGFSIFEPSENGWRVVDNAKAFPMSVKQITLTGFAVSRDHYCRPEDRDVDDLQFLEAGVECYIRNTAAIALFRRIETSHHVTPGGRQ